MHIFPGGDIWLGASGCDGGRSLTLITVTVNSKWFRYSSVLWGNWLLFYIVDPVTERTNCTPIFWHISKRFLNKPFGLLECYVPLTSKVIWRCELTHGDSLKTTLWCCPRCQLYSAALGSLAVGTITQDPIQSPQCDTEPRIPCHIGLLLSVRLISEAC